MIPWAKSEGPVKTVLKRLLQALAVLILVLAAAALWKREEVTRLMAVNSLFDEDRIVQNFSHMDELFLTRALSRGDGPVSPLPSGPAAALSPEAAA